MQREEPAARLVDALGDEIGRVDRLEIVAALKATESNSIAAIACSVKNQPRVWSTPSAMKSAG